MPAWCVPKNEWGECDVSAWARPAARPVAVPALAPMASPAAPAPSAIPSRPRRLTPAGPSVTGVSCVTSLQDGDGQLRQRLGERVDEIDQLSLLVLCQLAVVDQSIGERAV